ncbi:MAG: M1 family metallopeptidase [Saprospiraceae bacterium]|nr:M1 family metallopeptidase [Saprospiraceae bacterium]
MRYKALSIRCFIISLSLIIPCSLPIAWTQAPISRSDTLRGMLSSVRNCFDVKFYDLQVRIDPAEKWISGSNRIVFGILEETNIIQVDLFDNLLIQSIKDERGRNLKFERDHGATYIKLKQKKKPGDMGEVYIQYEGQPHVAKNPPWEGGVTWQKDKHGKPWIVVSCQGLGASVWWPNKDHQSDEPDSMAINITVPTGLQAISNGRLKSTIADSEGWTTFCWFVQNPINNYNVTFNIGDYSHFNDWYVNENGDSLSLDYYVMPENLSKARAQFMQVLPMLSCFENHFGLYPFYEDGYKLVETPYLGMEHQSAIAYGNHYENGYRGSASSQEGLWFDYIIIHETAHEWFGNSVTSLDIADMWIHESFGTYMESVYVECLYGYDAACRYMTGLKQSVQFDKPIVGTYNVNKPGSRDMYPKGALMLHTLRHVVANDEKWWAGMKLLALTYRHQNVDYKDITEFISNYFELNLSAFFTQYLNRTAIPKLQIRWKERNGGGELQYRWITDIHTFTMPVVVGIDGREVRLDATNAWKAMHLAQENQPEVKVNINWFVLLEYQQK